jgi:hypothetical protein
VDHRLPRFARRCGLYRDGGRARPRPAPPVVRRLGAAQAHHAARSDRPGKPGRRNFEELADLYLDEGHYAKARACYDRAISIRTDHPDPIYRRGIAEIYLGEFEAAVRDLEVVTKGDAKYDLHRAAGLLAHAYANTSQPERADALFRQVTEISTVSETYFNYAAFLAAQGRTAEAREWAQKILAKKPTMPRYLQRRERPWFRKANALLKTLGSG